MSIRVEFDGQSKVRFEGLEGWVDFTPAGNSPQHFRVTDIKTKKIEKILLDRGALFRCLNMPDMEAPGWTKKLPEIVFFCSQYCGTLLKVIDYTQDLWRHSSIKPLPRDDAAKIAGAITWTVLFAPRGGHLHIHKGVFNTVFGFYLLRTTKNGIHHVYLELELEIDIASAERKQSESDRKIKEQDDPLLLDLNENPFGIFSAFSLKSACRFAKEMPRVSQIMTRSGITPKKQNGVKKKVNSRLTAPIGHVRARSEKSPPPPKNHRRAVSGVAAVPASKPPSSPTKKTAARPSPQRLNSRLALTLAVPTSPPYSPPGMLIRGINRGDPHAGTKSAQRKRISSPPPARHPTSPENLRALKKRVEATRKRSMSARAPVNRPTAASPPPMSPLSSPMKRVVQLPLSPPLDAGVNPGPPVKLDELPPGDLVTKNIKRPPHLDISMDDSDDER